MARKADIEIEKQARDLIVAGNPIKAIWQSLREHKLSRSRIIEIRDEIASPRGLKWLADGPLLNADKPHHLRIPRKRQKSLPPVQLSILDIVDGHMGRTT